MSESTNSKKLEEAKISDLNPQSKNFTLIVQISEVLQKSSDQSEIYCRVVDDSGIINAYFNQYIKYLKPGNVYKMHNLRCKVVEHHLRVQMTKSTVVEKEALTIGFKDKSNDLSNKYYVTKDQIELTKKPIETKNIQQENPIKETKSTKKEENHQKNHQEKEKTEKQPRQTGKSKYIQKQEEPKNRDEKKNKVDNHNEENYSKNPKENKNKSQYVQKSGNDKKEYIEKQKVLDKQKTEGKQKQQKKNKLIYLDQISKFEGKSANFIVYLMKDTIIPSQNYWMGRVADQTGSIMLELLNHTKILEGKWYELNNFKVYGDKKYEFIVAQQKDSQIKIHLNGQEKYQKKPIKFTKSN